MAVKVLRVEGMRDDTRTDDERRALEAAEAQPLDMTVDAVLDAARRESGFDDFGPPDFVERLGLLLGEVAADDNVWNAHKSMFVDHCTKAAVNRLLIQHRWSEHPEARDVTIERPIDVIALPRSGSTHLENLVGADRRLRHLPVYVAAQPVPAPGDEPGPDGIDPRWKRADARWQMMRQNEIMAAMHEHSPDHACGENELQIPDFASYQWEWMAAVPGIPRPLPRARPDAALPVHARRARDDHVAVPERSALDAQVEPAQRAARAVAGDVPGRDRRDDPPRSRLHPPVAPHHARPVGQEQPEAARHRRPRRLLGRPHRAHAAQLRA